MRELRERIRESDGVLIVTPEYNRGVPGVLKNAVDWASRPYGQSVLIEKPVGIIGASQGGAGSVHAQLSLRTSLLSIGSIVMGRPELLVPLAHERFDERGRLTDATIEAALRRYLADFAGHIARVSTERTKAAC